jgi:hypothetical protein
MALFGLSPLFFSVIASKFFTDPISGVLNVANYTSFIALFNSIVYVAGFVFLQRVPCTSDLAHTAEAQDDPVTPPETEHTPLLTSSRKPADPTIPELLKLPDFWLLAIFCVLLLGLVRIFRSTVVKLSDTLFSAK